MKYYGLMKIDSSLCIAYGKRCYLLPSIRWGRAHHRFHYYKGIHLYLKSIGDTSRFRWFIGISL